MPAAAFGGHDFIAQLDGQEIAIQTSEPYTEDGHTLIDVDTMTNGEDAVVSYRYRVVVDGVVSTEGGFL